MPGDNRRRYAGNTNGTDGTVEAQQFKVEKKSLHPNTYKAKKILQMPTTASPVSSIFNDCVRWGMGENLVYTISKNTADLKGLLIIML